MRRFECSLAVVQCQLAKRGPTRNPRHSMGRFSTSEVLPLSSAAAGAPHHRAASAVAQSDAHDEAGLRSSDYHRWQAASPFCSSIFENFDAAAFAPMPAGALYPTLPPLPYPTVYSTPPEKRG